jgi:hypothetical protein
MVAPARGVEWFYRPLENLPPLQFSSPQEEAVTKAVCEREFADLCSGATRNGAMRMARQNVTAWSCKDGTCEINHKKLVKVRSRGPDTFAALGAVVVGAGAGYLVGNIPGAIFGGTVAFDLACPDSGDEPAVLMGDVFTILDVGGYGDDASDGTAFIDTPKMSEGLVDTAGDESLAEAEVAGILEDTPGEDTPTGEDTPAGEDTPVAKDTPLDILKTADVIVSEPDATISSDATGVADLTSPADLQAPADLSIVSEATPATDSTAILPADGAASDTTAPVLLGTAFCTNEFENTCLQLNQSFVSTCLYINDFQIKGNEDSPVTLDVFLSYKNDPISMTVLGNNVLPDTVMGGKLVCSPDPDSFEEGISGAWNCFKFGELKSVIAGTIYDGAIVMFPGSSTVGSEACESPYHNPCAPDDADMCINPPVL